MSSICQVQEIDPVVNKEAPAHKERVLVLFFLKRHTYHLGTLKGRKPAHTFMYFHTFVCAKVLSTAKDKLGNAPVFLSPCSFFSKEEMWTRNMHSSEGGEQEWRTVRVGH